MAEGARGRGTGEGRGAGRNGSGSGPTTIRAGSPSARGRARIPVPRFARWPAAVLLCLAAVPIASAQGMPDLSQPLTVDQLVGIALERNLALEQAQEQVHTAHGSRVSSYAGLLPNAFASADYNKTIANFSIPTIDPNSGRVISSNRRTVDTYYSMGLRGSLNLVDLPSWYNFSAAGSGYRASLYGLEDVRGQTALLVKQQYYALIRAQELARVAREAVDLQQEQLRRAQALFDLGSVAKSDVLQAQVNLATATREQITADNTVEVERARLAILLTLPVDAPLEVESPPPVEPAESLPEEDSLIREAIQARPDLAAAKASLSSASAQEHSAEANRYPSLSGGYFYSKQEDEIGNLADRLDKNARWGFSVGLSLTVFDGLQTKGAIQRATAGRRSRAYDVEQTRLQIALDVREALLQIRSASEGIRSARDGVAFAEESVRLQRALYEAGAGTLLEWNNAQVELTRARVALVEAQINLLLARAQLTRALGTPVPAS